MTPQKIVLCDIGTESIAGCMGNYPKAISPNKCSKCDAQEACKRTTVILKGD
ncbi:MAG: hypothetical protein ABSB71_09550 [Candidatus Bathyarchaeia archaeon]|jgi:hypothetical protein